MTATAPQVDQAQERRKPRRGAVAIDIILIVGLVGLVPQTLELSETARRFPLATMAVIVSLAVFDLLIELVPPVRRRMSFVEDDFIPVTRESQEVSEIMQEEEQEAEAHQSPAFRTFNAWMAMGCLVVAGGLMYAFGYLTATPVFLGAFFLWARVPIKVAVGITVTMSLLNYFAFYSYLGMR